MLKRVLLLSLTGFLFLPAVGIAVPWSGLWQFAYGGEPYSSENHRQEAVLLEGGLLRVRDTQASAGGGRGGADNRCWGTCFRNYNDCVDTGPKTMCVKNMKSCLALCDHLSNKLGR
jgi:hypothetical protein